VDRLKDCAQAVNWPTVAASGGKSNLNALGQSLLLLFTVIAAVAIGIVASYGTVTSILHALGQQSLERVATPVLVQNHASGD
jgi:hypothetical protein